MPDQLPGDPGYAGPAEVGGVAVEVRLTGHFEPIDGRHHWYGRVQPSPALSAEHRSGDEVVLRTPHGEFSARLSDVDPWGRFRISGTGTPPFALDDIGG